MAVSGVQLTDDSRLLPGVLAASRPLPTGWEAGIEVRTSGCAEPVIADRCVTDDEPIGLDVNRFDPALFRASAACAPMSRLDGETKARERLARTVEWSLGRLLATGEGTDNPSLADCDNIGTFLLIDAALGCLEQEAADRGFGGRVFLHLTLRAAYAAAAAGVIRPDGGRWLTPTGSTLVISSGYPSTGCPDGTETVWATGPVWAALSEVEILTPALNRRNESETWAQRYGLVAFDPCLNVCSTLTLGA